MKIYLFGPPGQPVVHRTINPSMIETLMIDGFVATAIDSDAPAGQYRMPEANGEDPVLVMSSEEAG